MCITYPWPPIPPPRRYLSIPYKSRWDRLLPDMASIPVVPFPQFIQPVSEIPFPGIGARFEQRGSRQLFRQKFLVGEIPFVAVGVFVIFSVIQAFHQAGRR